jgi:DNA-binding SARP family transcriptional activator
MLTIRLLGRAWIEGDGRRLPSPRGRKAWALLAYLLLTDRPLSRRHLAELLFSEADDPLGALRWTLAELRRALVAPELLRGDPVAPTLREGVEVDVHLLTGELADPSGLLGLGGELLEGLSVAASPAFESWLVVERHRLAAAAEARLRQAALALLAAGRADTALAYASGAVARNPLEEGNHELLVRSLAAAGDRAAALRQVLVGEDVLRRELGIKASPALREAADAAVGSPVGPLLQWARRGGQPARRGPGGDRSRRRPGWGGLSAPGPRGRGQLRCPALQARALVALGGALVHAVRGRDEEGAAVLHEAIRLATAGSESSLQP